MQTKKIAIIDLGTNTFHLMIAEKEGSHHKIISRERIAVKIGMGGINDGIITDDGLHRAINAMKKFKKTIDANNITSIQAFGTSALRNARNGKEVAKRLIEESGINVNIISGEEEAAYIYEGVKSAVKMGDRSSLIVDIGGGSIEFIAGNNVSIFWKHSFEIGAQRLLERFQKHDPILPDEIESLNDYITEVLSPLKEVFHKYDPKVIIGSSGTFDTLSEMYCLKENIPYSENSSETPLTNESFYKTFNELKQKNRAERLQMPGMIEMRVDMIVVASCVIDFLLRSHAFDEIKVSTYSLKEGVLASMR